MDGACGRQESEGDRDEGAGAGGVIRWEGPMGFADPPSTELKSQSRCFRQIVRDYPRGLMRKWSQPGAGVLFPLLALPEAISSNLASARSITIIVHGVGKATNETILNEAAKGYVASGLGGRSERLTLSECPTLADKNGADALVLLDAEGPHVLVALPWAGSRTRLSAIAQWSAVAVLGLTALATLVFAIRDPLFAIVHWLRPWSHRLLAYLACVVPSFLSWLLTSTNTRRFEPPSMSILALPPLLLVALLGLVKGTWLWMLMALLVGTLGLCQR